MLDRINRITAPFETNVSAQTVMANAIAENFKNKAFRRFNDAMTAFYSHPDVDTDKLNKAVPKYKQAFGIELERNLGADVNNLTQNMLQKLFSEVRKNGR